MSERKENSDELIHPVARPILFLGASWFKNAMIWVFGILTIAFIAADFFKPRHEYVHLAEFPGFYAYWGFGAFVLAVMVGWFGVRHFLGRPENYWDGEGKDD